jgi:hypothetical protein
MNNDKNDEMKQCTCLVAISMAMMAMHWCNAAHIAQWKIPRPARVADGHCHWLPTHSVLPRRPPGLHAKHNDEKYTLLCGHSDGHAPLWPF